MVDRIIELRGRGGRGSGAPGDPGADGLTNYEIAVQNGFVGTEADWLATLVGPPGPAGEATEDTTIRQNLIAASPGALTLTDKGLDTQTVLTAGAAQAYSDMISHWWQTPQNRLWGMDGGYAFNNVQPFKWAMFSMAENLYWRGKNGNTDAATKFKQNFDESLGREGQTLLQTASLANGIGAVDDAAWTMQSFTRVPQLLGTTTGAQALTMAKNLFTSTVSVFADPNNSGAGLLYTTDANSATLGHHRVGSINDIWIAIAAVYMYQNGANAAHLTFANHTYDWIKQYMVHPTGVLYIELDLDPSHGSAFLKPIGYSATPDPIKPHFSYTWIAGAFAFMTLCKRLNDIAPNAQYITDINAMMAAVLRTDTFLRPGDVFLNDRDGWAGGYGFCEFVDQVLPLTTIDADLKNRIKQVLVNTALSVINQRSDRFYYNRGVTYGAGFYGSDWSGPEMGANGMTTWFATGNDANGGIALPEQIMTSGSNMLVITAANMLPSMSVTTQYVPYTDMIARIQKIAETTITKVGNKHVRDDLNIGGALRFDTNAFLDLTGSNFTAAFDDQDYFLYDRTTNTGSYKVSGATVFYYAPGGISVTGGVSASGSVFAGTSADLNFNMGINGTNRSLAFDAGGDYFNFNRTSNQYDAYIGGASRLTVNTGGIGTTGVTATALAVSGGSTLSGTVVGGGTIQTPGAIISGTAFGVYSDGATTVGVPSFRMGQIYSTNSVVSTSDEREKEWRGPLTANELAAAKAIAAIIGAFQFKNAIEDKGSDGARLHIGVKAQEAGAILTAHGLDPHDYGWFCFDEWDAVEAVAEVPFIAYQPATFNDNGEQLTAEIPEQAFVPGVVARPAGNRYGVRYEELAMFIAAAQEQRLRALEA